MSAQLQNSSFFGGIGFTGAGYGAAAAAPADAPAASLASLRKGDSAVVSGLAPCEGADQLALRTRLLELGFAPGERVRVMAESFPRRDPMAVRLGNTTFALRRHEAALIQIERGSA